MHPACRRSMVLCFFLMLVASIGLLIMMLYMHLRDHVFALLTSMYVTKRSYEVPTTYRSDSDVPFYFPDAYDSRKVYGNQILSVQDQGLKCASCSLFTLLSLMADRIAIRSGEPAFPLSVQYVMDCLSSNPDYIRDVYQTLVLSTPETSIAPVPANIVHYELCSGNWPGMIAFYLSRPQGMGVVSATCVPYQYAPLADFTNQYMIHTRTVLRLRTPVFVLLSIMILIGLVGCALTARSRGPPCWMVYGGIVLLFCLVMLVLLYVSVTYCLSHIPTSYNL